VIERDVRPPGPYRLPPVGRDGVLRRRGGGLARVLHREGEPAIVHAWPLASAVRLRAAASSREVALWAIERMRFALGLDHDLSAFQRRFCRDRLLGPVIRRLPWLRPWRRPEPFEALAWAITEQLIESARAAAVQRRLVLRYGRPSPCRTLRDAPSAAELAARAPAELEACDLSAARALALVRAAREVARGRVDLFAAEPASRRLHAIRGIGPWTLECLALYGQGRDEVLPAGDLAYLKLVGRLARLGRRATEEEVRAFFAPYAPYAGLAGTYALRRASAGAPAPAGSRW
jgi:3-methyladenine DNA glycosylase/8-oxoguanine DNA glycosylase